MRHPNGNRKDWCSTGALWVIPFHEAYYMNGIRCNQGCGGCADRRLSQVRDSLLALALPSADVSCMKSAGKIALSNVADMQVATHTASYRSLLRRHSIQFSDGLCLFRSDLQALELGHWCVPAPRFGLQDEVHKYVTSACICAFHFICTA